jgi:hypothetical protein
LAYGFSLCGLADERGADHMPSERDGGQTESPGICAGVSGQQCEISSYLSAAETVLNVAFKFVPSACTVAMIATAMPAAMRPYSMAVAPDSSFTKRKKSVLIGYSRA